MLEAVHFLRKLLHLAGHWVELSKKLILVQVLTIDLVIGALTLGFCKEHHGIIATLGRKEDALEGADLVNEHAVVVLTFGAINFSLHGAYNCQEQVHEHNRVKYNAEQEQEHLGIAEAFGIVKL